MHLGIISQVVAIGAVDQAQNNGSTPLFTAPVGKDISPYPGRTDPVYVVTARKLPVEAAAAAATVDAKGEL